MTTKFIAGELSLADLQKAISYEELLFRKSTGAILGSQNGVHGNVVTFTNAFPKPGKLSLTFSSAPAPANSSEDWRANMMVSGSARNVTAWRANLAATDAKSAPFLAAMASPTGDNVLTDAESLPDLTTVDGVSQYSVKEGKLLDLSGNPVKQLSSPNQYAGNDPRHLVIHYTAGSTMTGAVSWFMNKAARASAHLVIGRDGSIVQLVPFAECAWHAGKSQWGNLHRLNAHSIGIELVNAGKLRRSPAGWVTWADILIPDDEVSVATHRNETKEAGWHEYTAAQLDALLDVAVALHDAYDFKHVLGHDDIAPDRKVDPGPLFPMESFRAKLLGRE